MKGPWEGMQGTETMARTPRRGLPAGPFVPILQPLGGGLILTESTPPPGGRIYFMKKTYSSAPLSDANQKLTGLRSLYSIRFFIIALHQMLFPWVLQAKDEKKTRLLPHTSSNFTSDALVRLTISIEEKNAGWIGGYCASNGVERRKRSRGWLQRPFWSCFFFAGKLSGLRGEKNAAAEWNRACGGVCFLRACLASGIPKTGDPWGDDVSG